MFRCHAKWSHRLGLESAFHTQFRNKIHQNLVVRKVFAAVLVAVLAAVAVVLKNYCLCYEIPMAIL